MLRFGLRRLGLAVPSLVFISAVLFGLLHLAPGGPAAVYASSTGLTAEQQQSIERRWGLDQPLPLRYLAWLSNVVQGDLGRSYRDGRPVTEVILERVPPTLLLMGTALVLGLVFAVLVAIFTATTRRASLRSSVDFLTLLGVSMPTFWIGLLFILVFAGGLGWIPAGGMATPGAPLDPLDVARHLVAPATVIALLYVARWSRYLHVDLKEVMSEDYIRTARSKGLPEALVMRRHVFRNSLTSLITLIGLEIGVILSGAVITEIVFSWPGMGRLVAESIVRRDYPVLMGTLVLIALVVVIANTITDLLYARSDPRIRLS